MRQFTKLAFPSSMSGPEFLSKGRGIAQNMNNFDPEELVVMQMIQAFQDEGRFSGIVEKFTKGDLTGCRLDRLETLMDEEEDRVDLLSSDQAPPPMPSANKAGKKPDTPTPAPASPPANMTVQFPPTRGVQWKAVQEVIKADKQCPCCFSYDSFHIYRLPRLSFHGFGASQRPSSCRQNY